MGVVAKAIGTVSGLGSLETVGDSEAGERKSERNRSRMGMGIGFALNNALLFKKLRSLKIGQQSQ
jgi:hypothetical protein